jgi:lipoteichoic acid synthase
MISKKYLWARNMRSKFVRGFPGSESWLLRPYVTIVIVLIAVFAFKLKLAAPAAHGAIVLPILQHDSLIFAFMLLFLVGGAAVSDASGHSFRRTTRAVSKLAVAAGLTLLSLYLVDVFTYYFFGTRLYVSDLVTFSSELKSAASLVGPAARIFLGFPAWKIVTITLIVVAFARACYMLVFRPLVPPWIAIGSLPLLALFFLPLPANTYRFDDKPLYENFIERNFDYFSNNSFTNEFRSQLLANAPKDDMSPGRGRRINLVVLIVESLSAYHSQLFSDIENWTPQLDAIARRETALKNFHANGWTTVGGLISILGRSLPLVPEHAQFNIYGSPRFTDFINLDHPLAQELREHGYSTTFIAAGDLTFLGQDRWLGAVGFDRLVGHDDPRFAAQLVRGPFKSVPDELLFKVAFNEIERLPSDRPFFMVVQTYWSHRPFIDPNGGHLDGEEPVIRETDRQIGAFYDRLEKAKFFENGILLITGDHRAVEPYRKSEFDRFGASAIARVPGVVATQAIALPHEIDGDFQQRDIGASIEELVLDSVSLRPYEGLFLRKTPLPPGCIFHAHGIDRDLVFVKCGEREATVRTMGDQTRVVSGSIPDEKSVLQTINLARTRSSRQGLRAASSSP